VSNFAQANTSATGGMLPTYFNSSTGEIAEPYKSRQICRTHSSIAHLVIDWLAPGAMADSGHEYLLKLYLLTGRSDMTSLQMCKSEPSGSFFSPLTYPLIPDLRFTTETIDNLIYLSPTRELMYVTDVNHEERVPTHSFQHLSTFIVRYLHIW
jgi:hypothetical protein